MSLHHLFCPESVAVIGAAREKRKVGHTIFCNIIDSGYKGSLFPINPKAEKICGVKCYPSVLDVPHEIDLAVIVIPSVYVLKILDECSKKNIKWSIIISAGFKESGVEGSRR